MISWEIRNFSISLCFRGRLRTVFAASIFELSRSAAAERG